MNYLPGTKLEAEDISLGFEHIAPSLAATKGFTLSQVCTITGLEASTVQNWIKRSWVARPENKRYGEYQLARIMIINMLRTSLQLDKIAFLLRYINGEAENRGDDIIPDSVLYTRLCGVIDSCVKKQVTSEKSCKQAVSASLADYKEAYAGAKEKLTNALTAMTLAYISGEIKKESDNILQKLQTQGEF